MSGGLCTCGEPIATCPHLGIFASKAAKRAWYEQDLPELHQALDVLDVLSVRADAKRAVQIAQIAAEHASNLPAGEAVSRLLAVVVAALAKAAALAGL